MSKKPKDLKIALNYLGRAEYSRVIRLLESKIPIYVENREFYTILAKAFYYTGDYAGAKLYFDRGQKIHWEIESALFLAVLGIKRRDFNSALRIWLDILDENPENKLARRGLETLKKYSTMDELESFIHSNKIDKLVPKRKIKLTTGTTVSIITILVIILLTVTAIRFSVIDKIIDYINNPSHSTLEVNREGAQGFELDSANRDYLDFSEQSIYTFTGEQIEALFKDASDLFINNRDNLVKTYLNLIKYSNANEQLKNKAELLDHYLIMPSWASYDDDFNFEDINRDVYKYDHCIVKWKGTISNLEIRNRKIFFTLLVGYDSGKILEGTVDVELNENIKIQENQPIEVLGKVIPRDDSFFLEAQTVMQYVVNK